MINSFVFSLPVKIIQLCVNIIFGSVYKMTETVMAILLVILIGTFGVLSYLLGRIHGKLRIESKWKTVLEDTAKAVQDNIWTIGKQ